MAETVEQYEQELLVKDRWIELRTEDVENLKSVRSLYIELYFEMYSEVNGILLADVIFRLHERGVYDQAAAELINFTEQGFSLPKDQTIRSQSIAASPASAVSGLLPLYHVNYHSRLVEVARALFDMGLIEQTHLDYVTMHSVRSSVKVN